MEKIYQDDLGKVRERAVRRSFLPTIVIYNALLLTDIALLPDTAKIATFLHFGVVTPALLIIFYLYGRIKGFLQRQLAEAAIPVLISVQTLTVMALNDAPNAGYYQYFVPLILLFSNVNQRLDMRIASATSGLILSLYGVVLLLQDLPLEHKIACLSFTVVASYLGLSANLRAQRDARYGFLLRLREHVRLQAAETDALHDPLTGLSNRRYLTSFAERLSHAEGEGTALSMILMDIDFFKAFNDFHGHGRGDDCIRIVAETIVATVRPYDGIAVRYGGEEFLVILSGVDHSVAAACAETIRQAVEGLAISHGRSSVADSVTISLGVASGTVMRDTFELLIASADAALYAAKAGGRNRVTHLDPDAGKRNGPDLQTVQGAKRVLH